MDILQLKLEKELLQLALDYIKECTIDDKNWIQKRINFYVDEINIMFDTKQTKQTKHKNACCARLWDTGIQCSSTIKIRDYCGKHNKMLDTYGVLRFGDIREERPYYDLIKLKNGITERLHWINPNPLERLQVLLDQQCKKVILSSRDLIVN